MSQQPLTNKYLPPRDALNMAMKEFGIMAKDLAECCQSNNSKIDRPALSRFLRNDKEIISENLYALEVALMEKWPAAADYYFALRQGKSFSDEPFVRGLRYAEKAIAQLIEQSTKGVIMFGTLISKWCQRRGMSIEEFKQQVAVESQDRINSQHLEEIIDNKTFPSENDLKYLARVMRKDNGEMYDFYEFHLLAVGVKSLNGEEINN